MKFSLALAFFALSACASASAEAPERIGAVELDNSVRYMFESTKVGDRFRIDVLLPIGYAASTERYPMIYVTDSNYLLPSAAATYLAQATDEYPKCHYCSIEN